MTSHVGGPFFEAWSVFTVAILLGFFFQQYLYCVSKLHTEIGVLPQQRKHPGQLNYCITVNRPPLQIRHL